MIVYSEILVNYPEGYFLHLASGRLCRATEREVHRISGDMVNSPLTRRVLFLVMGLISRMINRLDLPSNLDSVSPGMDESRRDDDKSSYGI